MIIQAGIVKLKVKKVIMAKNGKIGDGHRNGAVKGRSQFFNFKNKSWIKRNKLDGKIIDVKCDDKPFKGVTKEK